MELLEWIWKNYVIYNFALCIFQFLPFGAFWRLLETFGDFLEPLGAFWSLLEHNSVYVYVVWNVPIASIMPAQLFSHL